MPLLSVNKVFEVERLSLQMAETIITEFARKLRRTFSSKLQQFSAQDPSDLSGPPVQANNEYRIPGIPKLKITPDVPHLQPVIVKQGTAPHRLQLEPFRLEQRRDWIWIIR